MEQHKIECSTMDLIDAVCEIFEAELAKGADAAPNLDRALALMPELCLDPDRPGPSQQSACLHLPRALDLGEAGPAAK